MSVLSIYGKYELRGLNKRMKLTTKNGSTVVISGKYNGIYDIMFDWFEERACIESSDNVWVDKHGSNYSLCWSCDCCGAFSAELLEV